MQEAQLIEPIGSMYQVTTASSLMMNPKGLGCFPNKLHGER